MLPLLLAALLLQPLPEMGGLQPPPASGPLTTPRDAVMRAAEAAPDAVPGTFVMTVRAAGRDRQRLFLNSERDYRDQRNLSIEIQPAAAAALARNYGMSTDDAFIGRTLLVRGAARRTRIDFYSNGRLTGLYYYQTHVVVTDPDQIRIVDAPTT